MKTTPTRKIIVTLTAILMIFSTIQCKVYGADFVVSKGNTIEIGADANTFSFDVSLNGVAEPYATMEFHVQIPKDKAALSNVTFGSGVSGLSAHYILNETDSQITYAVGVANGSNVFGSDTAFCNLEFDFKGNAGESVSILILEVRTTKVISYEPLKKETDILAKNIPITVTKTGGIVPPPPPPTPIPSPSPEPSPGNNNPPGGNTGNGSTSGGENRGTAAETPILIQMNEDGTPLGMVDVAAWAGYISGFPDGTVRPDHQLTRGQMAVMMYNLVANKDLAGTADVSFSDLNENAYYHTAVMYLARHRIISGYPDGTFRGEDNISRAEASTIISFFVTDDPLKSSTKDFGDIKGHWGEERISLLVKNGCISGYPDATFKPDNKITRAEAICIINRAIGRNVSTISDTIEIKFSDITPAHWAYKDILAATGN